MSEFLGEKPEHQLRQSIGEIYDAAEVMNPSELAQSMYEALNAKDRQAIKILLSTAREQRDAAREIEDVAAYEDFDSIAEYGFYYEGFTFESNENFHPISVPVEAFRHFESLLR